MVARGETRSAALLAAALQVLIRDGYDRFSMDSVAALAHASKTTIYRRWNNKAELIKAALDAHDASFNDEVSDTGGLRTDLIATMGMLRRKAQALPPTLYPDLMRAMEHDETLSDAIHRHLADPGLSPFDAPLSRAVGRGEAGVDVDRQLIHDVAEAMLTHRLTLGGPLDDAFIGRLVDDVLLVLIRPGAR